MRTRGRVSRIGSAITQQEQSIMVTRKSPAKKPSKKVVVPAKAARSKQPNVAEALSDRQLAANPIRRASVGARALTLDQLRNKLRELNIKPTVGLDRLVISINKIKPDALVPVSKLPEDLQQGIKAMAPAQRRVHGTKFPLSWFPPILVKSPCADKFGYMSSAATRASTSLPFDAVHQALMNQLGDLMGDPGRETGIPDSPIPAGYTYVGQFVDHDITLDVSSTLDAATDATTLNNMRTPSLDLDSVYGRGPALDPYLYAFPTVGPDTAIKLQLGSNRNTGPGGPAGSAGTGAAMQVQTDFDVPRMHNFLNPGASSNTAVIGDPRNDENLIVSQFQQTMLRFHNRIVDLLVLAGFTGDIFVEARKIATHHYQWAVVKDFLSRICGAAQVSASMASVVAPIDSAFRMPVEFAVAAYRFGHSMIRDNYWVNFNFPNATLGQVFQFIRAPNLPVLSNWVVDFNAFFTTGVAVPVDNKARKIDSVLARGLETLPGFSGLMAVLAKRNLRRALALGLPSGQGMATSFGLVLMTPVQLKQGLPANEVALLDSNGGVLLKKTPLWYYVLREAAVLNGGNQLGPVGGRIVADTFVRILKRDANSYLNVAGGFTPMLPAAAAGNFTFADLVVFAGVTQP
jgi:Animal haem peroxidase